MRSESFLYCPQPSKQWKVKSKYTKKLKERKESEKKSQKSERIIGLEKEIWEEWMIEQLEDGKIRRKEMVTGVSE